MADLIRFYFDNHLANAVAERLQRQGIDEDFIALAADFLTRGEKFAEIVYCHPAVYGRRPGLLIQDLLILHGVYTADDMRNRLEYL